MNVQPTEAAFGGWKSRFQPDTFADLLVVSEPIYGPAGHLAWAESTPDGWRIRTQLPDGQAGPDLATEHELGGRVGYGGGAFTLGREAAYFIDRVSGRLFRQAFTGGPARAITPAFGGAASPTLSPDGRWLLYVHTYEEIDTLAVVPADGGAWPARLAAGADFYMQPAWHPDSRQVAWVQWNHPAMPWDSTELCLAELRIDEGHLPVVNEVVRVAGGPDAGALQPTFTPDGGGLAYLSDHEGRWQLYLYDLKEGQTRRLTETDKICGGPPWVQGVRHFDFSWDGGSIYAILSQNGLDSLWQIVLESGEMRRLPLPDGLTVLSQLSARPDRAGLAFLASGVSRPPGLYTWSPEDGVDRAAGPSLLGLSRDHFSQPRALEWQSEDGHPVHGLYYPPHNPAYHANGLPPLIVHVHSGPTSQSKVEFDPSLQFFTSRGYAVLTVNYRGSAGYGRAYRQALHGNWGVVDVADVASGAAHVVEQGLADPSELTLIGGSAGGFTALMALVRYPGRFKTAICRYPVTQHPLVPSGHKFERFYNHSLLGPLPAQAEVYRERSPIALADRIQDPVLLFHGTDDPVIPESHTAEFVQKLRANGVPCGYRVFEGEGHGFRQPENIETYYRLVGAFLREGELPEESL